MKEEEVRREGLVTSNGTGNKEEWTYTIGMPTRSPGGPGSVPYLFFTLFTESPTRLGTGRLCVPEITVQRLTRSLRSVETKLNFIGIKILQK